MFIKSVLKDSFKELKFALKNPKLLIFSSLVVLVNTFFVFKYYVMVKPLLVLIPLVIINLFFATFQYSSLGKIIHSKDKKIIKNMKLSFVSRLIKLIKVILVLIIIAGLIAAGLMGLFMVIEGIALKGAGGYGLAFIIERFYKMATSIILILFMARALLSVPLCILDDTYRPIHLSLEITDGYFWRLSTVGILIPSFFIYLNAYVSTFLLNFLKLNFIFINIITLPISVVITR